MRLNELRNDNPYPYTSKFNDRHNRYEYMFDAGEITIVVDFTLAEDGSMSVGFHQNNTYKYQGNDNVFRVLGTIQKILEEVAVTQKPIYFSWLASGVRQRLYSKIKLDGYTNLTDGTMGILKKDGD